MIELPEATNIAHQINTELKGKQVVSGNRGNTPHKFAFYRRTPEEYTAILTGKTVTAATEHGAALLVSLVPDYTLILGGGGERILYHSNDTTLPKKYHLLLHFNAGGYLTVSVQGWGSCLLLHNVQDANHPWLVKHVHPLSKAFTYEYFHGLWNDLVEGDPRSVKFFLINKPGVWGVGNGYLQDILFRARLHPRRKVFGFNEAEKRSLYEAVCTTLKLAVDQRGRDTEFDIHNSPGGYTPLMDKRTNGQPCTVCGTPIKKEAYLGGAVYFCPHCQK